MREDVHGGEKASILCSRVRGSPDEHLSQDDEGDLGGQSTAEVRLARAGETTQEDEGRMWGTAMYLGQRGRQRCGILG